MSTTITSKGQVTIPKHIRDSVAMTPGSKVEFEVNDRGRIELVKEGEAMTPRERRFQSAIGSASIKWDTDELMALLRGND
ncbi:AbrB/MazE/SpoVT family DNA-binding domain-containing protein [Acidicapsa ligni]|uniref:AbrB/MazE/SpoVT family DNA-binding domain-containing protein n=1 Tax=Acidicapsa ligni TaxID=542300 RepID=UPI0021E0E248|nr:AbrB/MazE/SpoVT family DNA-binding domain-containing protein [Acidicapsa ligni]